MDIKKSNFLNIISSSPAKTKNHNAAGPPSFQWLHSAS